MGLDSLALSPVRCRVAVNEPNFNRAFYLPRLPREYYQGDAVVHRTLPISHRRRGWLDERFHAAFRELLLHTAARSHISAAPTGLGDFWERKPRASLADSLCPGLLSVGPSVL